MSLIREKWRFVEKFPSKPDHIYGEIVPWVTAGRKRPIFSKRTTMDETELLSDEELLLASPILYGFSLSDKTWSK